MSSSANSSSLTSFIFYFSLSSSRENEIFNLPTPSTAVFTDQWNHCDQLHVAPPLAFVSRFTDATTLGRDALTYSGCSIVKNSHGCYLPLFRQFRRPPNAPALNTKHITVGASILQFSGKEYYHWIVEGLSRLLILQVRRRAGKLGVTQKGRSNLRGEEKGGQVGKKRREIARFLEMSGQSASEERRVR